MFIAAALASTASGCEDKPLVCLAPVANEFRDATAAPPDAGTGPAETEPPMPCLSIAIPTDAGPRPRPCLKVAMPRDAGPEPCLSY